MVVRTPLVVVGGGNMGSALVRGMLAAGGAARDLAICEVSSERRDDLRGLFPGVEITATIPSCDGAIIAVKPGDASQACRDAASAGARRVVSIAAGVRLRELQSAAGAQVRVLRAMPNTPATVGLAATALACGDGCGPADREWARGILSAVGSVIDLDEAMLDAFTGLVGSGPAYVFYVAEALRDAALGEGFDEATAVALVARVLVGSAALLEREPAAAGELRRRVTSPNGTTAAGVARLDEFRTHDAFVAAVRAAAERSRELGDAR